MRLVLASLVFTALPFASSMAEPPHRPHRPPPKEAFDACANKAKADACAFTIHDHDISGTCEPAPPESDTLACKPDHPPPGPPPDGDEPPAK